MLKIILIIFVFPFFISCVFDKDCPNFDKNIIKWTPYEKGNLIKLVNKNGYPSIEFTIDSFDIFHDKSYNEQTNCIYCKNEINIISSESVISNRYGECYKFSYQYLGSFNDLDIERYSIYYNDTPINFEFGRMSELIQEYENYSFDGVNFENVKIYEAINNTLDSDEIFFYKLIVVKDLGIIGFVDESIGEYWIRDDYSNINNSNLFFKIKSRDGCI